MTSRISATIALLFLALVTSSIVRWHQVDTRPSCLDETRHMQLAMDYKHLLTQGVPLTNEWSHVYPPLYHLSIIPALSIGAPSERNAALTHVFYLFLLTVGCVLFSRQARRPDYEGVLAAILCTSYYFIFWETRRALTDLPMAALTTLAMGLLYRTDGYSTWSSSLLWGSAMGIGLLIKVPFLFFCVGPVFWVYVTSRHPDKTRHLLGGFAVAALIAMPWYFWQSVYFLSKGSSLAMERTGNTDPHTLEGWLFYIRSLPGQLGQPGLVVTVIGMTLALFHTRRDGRGVLIAWILSGYLILSLLLNKDPRHTIPLFPAMALLAVQGWGRLAKWAWAQVLLVALGLGLLVYSIRTYDPPVKEDWKHIPILQLLEKRHDPAQPFLSASILSHQYRFFSRTIRWTAQQVGIPLKPVSPGDSNASFPEFIIRRTGDQGSETATLEGQWQELLPTSRAFTSLFSVIERVPLYDESQAVIYQRDPHPQFKLPSLTHEAVGRQIATALGQWVDGPLKVRVEATPQGLREGHLDRVTITCEDCSAKGVPVRQIKVVAEKPWLNLYRLWDEHRMGILAFESFKPSCEVSDVDLKAALSKVKGLTDPEVEFKEGSIRVKGRYKGIPVGTLAHVTVDQSRFPGLDAVLDRVTVAGIPIPGWILGKARRQTLILYPIPDFPGRILIERVTTENGKLIIT